MAVLLLLLMILMMVMTVMEVSGMESASTIIGNDNIVLSLPSSKNAYATMLYMGTPRDHEFYVAARVMLRSLAQLGTDADLVVIASNDLPMQWVKTLQVEGARVVLVDNIKNPYSSQPGFNQRFLFTLNKLYVWSLVEYERVVMLDTDNLFLQNTDELFQCGQFCAVFINPCIFHTGLFVLEPSRETFKKMVDGIGSLRNKDGADQGYLTSFFHDLLERPLFRPQGNGSRVDGLYRLPLGYQMDASFYYLKLRWSIPCGSNSVITFPSMPWLKPWYWWSWPVLPLGLSWHQQRVQTIGYESEIPIVAAEAVFYIVIMLITYIAQRGPPNPEKEKVPIGAKVCLLRGIFTEHCLYPYLRRLFSLVAIVGSFVVPLLLVPRTIHPVMGWSLLLLGSFSFLMVNISIFHLPCLALLTPWFGIVGALLVLASPFYRNGIARGLSIGTYAFLASPFLWWALKKVNACSDLSLDRDHTKLRSEPQQSELMKLC